MSSTFGTEAAGSRIGTELRELGIDQSTSPTPAIRGRPVGREAWTGATDGAATASFLGLFSVGLGFMQLLAPGRMTRLIGLSATGRRSTVMQAMGLREISHGFGILTNPKSKEWVGIRIGGDALDLVMLGIALTKSDRPERTLMAAGAVLGVAALDVLATEQLAQRRKAPSRDVLGQLGTHVQKSITVVRPVHEVYGFWRDFTNLPRFMRHLESVQVLGGGRSRWRVEGPAGTSAEWEAEIVDEQENEHITWRAVGAPELYNEGTVRFRQAAAGRGTIVTVEMRFAPPGGKIGAAMLKLFRKEPGQQVGDDLRNLKQVLETGEVVVSDATAVGGPHPAQPSLRAERR